MTVYIVLYIIIALCILLENTFSFGKKVSCTIISVAIICIVGLRSENMGYDIPGYLKSFEYLSRMSLQDTFSLSPFRNYEKGYVLFNSLLGFFSTDIHVFLFVCMCVSFIPVVFFLYRNSEKFAPSIVIYLSLPPFLLLFSGIRQSIAIGICLLSIEFVIKRKLLLFLLMISFAMSFHSTAILFVIVYPLYVLKLDKPIRWLSVFLLVFVYAFKMTLFIVLTKMFNVDPNIDNNGAVTLMIFFILIYIFLFLCSHGTEKEEGLLNIFYIACFCQMFSSLNSIAIRAGYYFMIILAPLIPMVIDNMKEKNERFSAKICVSVCFILAGLFFISNSSWAEANPHYWFWE